MLEKSKWVGNYTTAENIHWIQDTAIPNSKLHFKLNM